MGTRVARYGRPMTQPLVTLYTSSYCGYCRAAKGLLQRRNVAFQEIDLTGDDAGREALVERSGGQRTVPQIWVGEHHIGGFDELNTLDRSGELARLLDPAPTT